jgi:hypothetical protein
MIRILFTMTTILMFASGALADELSEHAKKAIVNIDRTSTTPLQVVWQDSSSVHFSIVRYEDMNSNEYFIPVFENRTFVVIHAPFGQFGDGTMILISQVSEWVIGVAEGNSPWLKAQAYYLDNTGSVRKLWSISEGADIGQDQRPFYETVEFGCCAGRDISRLHSLQSGQLVMTHTGDLLRYSAASEISWQQDADRFIGSLEYGYLEDSVRTIDSLTLAQLDYASRDSCLHTIRIRAKTRIAWDTAWDNGPGEWIPSLLTPDSVNAELVSGQSGHFITGDPRLLPTRDYSAVRIKSAEDPVFFVLLWNDDFWLKQTDFGDYEIVRIK